MSGLLVGRTAEAGALRGFLRASRAGRAPVVLVSGEAGVGKTALVEHVLTADGGMVLRGQAAEWQPAAYDLLAQVLRAMPSAESAGQPARGGLDAVLHNSRAGPAQAPPKVAEAVCAALTRAAQDGAITVFLDDLQWADDATLDLLPQLADQIAGRGILLIGCFRSEELPRDHLLRSVRAELRRRNRLAEISLASLGTAEVTQLLAGLLGAEPEPSLVTAIGGRADGMPFAVEELAAALRQSGQLVYRGPAVALTSGAEAMVPDSVREAVLLRTARLTAAEISLLQSAAVAGAAFDVDLVASVAQAPAWSDRLAEAGLVTDVADGRSAFRHSLTRDAIYADIGWSGRRDLHRRTAEALAADGAPQALVAAHLLAARDTDKARGALLAAAAEHLCVHAYRDAARALRQALELWPSAAPQAAVPARAQAAAGADEPARLTAVEQLAHCAEMCADHVESASLLRELVQGRLAGLDIRGAATAQRRLALAHELLGQWDAALACREAAAAGYAASGLPAEAAIERLAAASHLRSAAAYSAALGVLAAARADAELSGRTDLLLRVDGLRGNILSRIGRADDGVAAVRAALGRALELPPTGALTMAAAELQQRLADALEHAGDYQAAAAAYGSAYAFCDARGQDATGQLCRACVTAVLFPGGLWDRAADLCADVLAAPLSQPHTRSVGAGMLGLVHAMRGQPELARPLLLESRSIATRIELTAMELLSGWGLCVLADLSGDRADAEDRGRMILDRWESCEERHYCVPVLQWLSTFFAENGAASQTRRCAAALSSIAQATARPEALAALAHAVGESALFDGEPKAAARAAARELLRAVELFTPLGLPLATATAQRRAGAALALAGDRDQAVVLLLAALATARPLDAGPLCRQIEAALADLGARPRAGRRGRSRAGAPGGLSRREIEVMLLVAQGNTSREIGSQLFLSPRTVEMHVRGCLLKLECRTRAEGVRRIAELGLMQPS
jgi:DNA-binding CsgD family transcriptional regulator